MTTKDRLGNEKFPALEIVLEHGNYAHEFDRVENELLSLVDRTQSVGRFRDIWMLVNFLKSHNMRLMYGCRYDADDVQELLRPGYDTIHLFPGNGDYCEDGYDRFIAIIGDEGEVARVHEKRRVATEFVSTNTHYFPVRAVKKSITDDGSIAVWVAECGALNGEEESE